MLNTVLDTFSRLYGGGAPRLFFAPGRVNLIGEHTDYNGGHVFPCALSLGTWCAARMRDDRQLRMYSVNFPDAGIVETDLDRTVPLPGGCWANYPLGVVRAFLKAGCVLDRGLDLVFGGDIPFGSGLSSSAALEVLTGVMLRGLFGLELDNVRIALLGQYAENHFVGLSSGIMDQFASAMGRRDHAIFLDTQTLEYQYAPLKLNGAHIMIVNSMVRHALAGSSYNDRRRECEQALAELQKSGPFPSLGALSTAQFDALADGIADPVCRRRARHAVYENARTVLAFLALQRNDLGTFGREVDLLVELAWACPGVLGSRITGGGFGGCTVSIVRDEHAEQFITDIKREYARRTGLEAQIYTVCAGDGARELTGETEA